MWQFVTLSRGRGQWPRFLATVGLGIAATLSSLDGARAEAVDVELVFAVDGSGSIDENEFRYQREGYAAAITHPRVVSAVTSGPHGKVAMAFVEWGGEGSIHTIVDWAVISNEASAKAFAAQLLAAPRKAIGYNSISGAIIHATAMIEGNSYKGERKVIDVSGDGPQIGGPPLEPARIAAVRLGITINGLVVAFRGGAIGGGGGVPLAQHYKRDVIGGRGAFVIIADDKNRFAAAILAKLVREIAGKGPGGDERRFGLRLKRIDSAPTGRP
jgi:hypothetical protein